MCSPVVVLGLSSGHHPLHPLRYWFSRLSHTSSLPVSTCSSSGSRSTSRPVHWRLLNRSGGWARGRSGGLSDGRTVAVGSQTVERSSGPSGSQSGGRSEHMLRFVMLQSVLYLPHQATSFYCCLASNYNTSLKLPTYPNPLCQAQPCARTRTPSTPKPQRRVSQFCSVLQRLESDAQSLPANFGFSK